METDFYRIRETFTLGDIVHVISHARRNIFPVIDDFGRLIGVVQLDDLREDMFKREKWGTPIGRYMIQSIQGRDIPSVMGCIIIFALSFAVINLIVDLIYGFIDPRIKAQYK